MSLVSKWGRGARCLIEVGHQRVLVFILPEWSRAPSIQYKHIPHKLIHTHNLMWPQENIPRLLTVTSGAMT